MPSEAKTDFGANLKASPAEQTRRLGIQRRTTRGYDRGAHFCSIATPPFESLRPISKTDLEEK